LTPAIPIGNAMSVRVVSVSPDDSVQLAIQRMMEEGIGAVTVCEGPKLVGIFSERDVLRLAAEGPDFATVNVGDVMTKNVITVSADVGLLEAARMMGERRIRHLPVVEGENVLGIVGIRDVLTVLGEWAWREHDDAARETARELLGR
jgi:CBS domain-containing protein